MLSSSAGPFEVTMNEVVVIELDSLKDLLREELERFRASLETPEPSSLHSELPPKCRRDLPQIAVLLSLPKWEDIVRAAAHLKVDLRDLGEVELAWLENVKVKSVQNWRTRALGPSYRNQAGILSYPLRWYYEWREKSRQSSTAQGTRRGRRSDYY
jgi:hypothetical protein